MRLPRSVRRAGARAIGGLRLPILSGPNRGLLWSLASSGRGYLTGSFERRRVDSFVSSLRPGDRVWDLGAHKGYLTLAAARAVGPEGAVLAIEPAEENLALLRRHLEWNGVRNVRTLAAAVTDRDGEAAFRDRGSSFALRLEEGGRPVPTRSLRSLLEEFETEGLSPPDVLKVDVEGQEAVVLRGAEHRLPADLLIWISVHSRALYRACVEWLDGKGFRRFESPEIRRTLEYPALPWGGDAEILAVGPERVLEEGTVRTLPLFR